METNLPTRFPIANSRIDSLWSQHCHRMKAEKYLGGMPFPPNFLFIHSNAHPNSFLSPIHSAIKQINNNNEDSQSQWMNIPWT